MSFGNDKAIEYYGELLKTQNMLSSLEFLRVDVSEFSWRIQKIEEEVKQGEGTCKGKETSYSTETNYAFDYVASLENIYLNGIKELGKIQKDMVVYEVYFKGKAITEVLEGKVNQDMSLEEISINAKEVLSMIKKLNNSGTRVFDSEENVVNDLYNLAFEIMLLEIIKLNNSVILNGALIDEDMHNHLNKIAKEKIDEVLFIVQDNISDELKETIKIARAIGDLNINYLDKNILLSLAFMERFRSMKAVSTELKNISNQISKNDNEMHNLSQTKTEKSKIFKDIAVTIIGLSLIVSSLGFSIKQGVNKNFYPTYLTHIEVYDGENGLTTVGAASLEKQLRDDFSPEILLYSYGNWNDNSDGYYRFPEKYDISDYPISSYEDINNDNWDILNIPKKPFGFSEKNSFKQEKKSLEPEDLNFENDFLIVKKVQEEGHLEYHQDFLGFLWSVLWRFALNSLILIILDAKLTDETSICFINSVSNLKQKYISIKKRKEAQETRNKLLAENNKLAQEFIKLYEQYSMLLKSDTEKEIYEKLKRDYPRKK